jgi:predicted PurR-regulated permease PerM
MYLDEMLSRYFKSKEHYMHKVQEALWQKEQLLAAAYTHTSYDDLGLRVVTMPLEDYAIRSEAIDNRIKQLSNVVDQDKRIFNQALKVISRRQRILLHVFYQTGITLTTAKELLRAKEHLLEALDQAKDKLSHQMKAEYMKQFKGKGGGYMYGKQAAGR